MKKLLSIILATAMIISLIPGVFATETGTEATETQNLKIVYDIGRVFRGNYDNGNFTNNKDNIFGFLQNNLQELSDGFFKINSESTSFGVSFRYNRGSATSTSNNGIDLAAGYSLVLDVYVPVKGLYTMSGNHPHFGNGGVIEVYVNGSDEENKVGGYDSSPASSNITSGYQSGDRSYSKDERFELTDIRFEEGWNSIKFVASNPVTMEDSTIYKGTLRTFTLTLGDATDSDYALMGVHEKEFTLGTTEAYAITTVKSSVPATVLTGLTYTSANSNIATVSAEGVITPLAHGKTTVTVRDNAGRSYDIAVTVNDPTKPTIKYDIHGFITTTTEDMSIITEEATNGFFRYNSGTGGKIRHRTSAANRCIDVYSGKYLILDVYVPVAGTYAMSGLHPHFTGGGVTKVYINGSETEAGSYDSTPVAERHPSPMNGNSYGYNEEFVIEGISLNKGWNTFKFEASDGTGTVKTFTLTAGTGNAVIGLSEKEIAIGETDTVKAYLSSTAAELTNVTYASDNSDVAEVLVNGSIKAKAYGEANITVTYSGDDVISGMNSFTTKVSVNDAKTDFVTVAIDDDGDGKVTIAKATLGEEVTATANVPEDKIFRGWVRGSEESGRLVSTESPYTFKAMTNIYLTAVYSDASTAETNEYYNWDGQFLGNTEPATVPSLVGYTFAKTWTKAKVEDLITSWIADFTKNDETYDVTGTGFTMSNADSKYDTEVTCTSDSAVYWYRDNKLVDYGTEYKFFIWDKTNVTTSNEGHDGAKLMLDTKKGNSYMVEYDAGNATLLEVGILFGASGEVPTVESCQEKMSSQRNLNEAGHGQFSATSGYPVARGYLIYKDGNTYRVIYADLAE